MVEKHKNSALCGRVKKKKKLTDLHNLNFTLRVNTKISLFWPYYQTGNSGVLIFLHYLSENVKCEPTSTYNC